MKTALSTLAVALAITGCTTWPGQVTMYEPIYDQYGQPTTNALGRQKYRKVTMPVSAYQTKLLLNDTAGLDAPTIDPCHGATTAAGEAACFRAEEMKFVVQSLTKETSDPLIAGFKYLADLEKQKTARSQTRWTTGARFGGALVGGYFGAAVVDAVARNGGTHTGDINVSGGGGSTTTSSSGQQAGLGTGGVDAEGNPIEGAGPGFQGGGASGTGGGSNVSVNIGNNNNAGSGISGTSLQSQSNLATDDADIATDQALTNPEGTGDAGTDTGTNDAGFNF